MQAGKMPVPWSGEDLDDAPSPVQSPRAVTGRPSRRDWIRCRDRVDSPIGVIGARVVAAAFGLREPGMIGLIQATGRRSCVTQLRLRRTGDALAAQTLSS